MALITTAPSYIDGYITMYFQSVAQLTEETPRMNYVFNFTTHGASPAPIYGVKAVYTDEEDQIADLSTQQTYGVFFKPVLDDGSLVFTAEFMGETYVGSISTSDEDLVDILTGSEAVEFAKQV